MASKDNNVNVNVTGNTKKFVEAMQNAAEENKNFVDSAIVTDEAVKGLADSFQIEAGQIKEVLPLMMKNREVLQRMGYDTTLLTDLTDKLTNSTVRNNRVWQQNYETKRKVITMDDRLAIADERIAQRQADVTRSLEAQNVGYSTTYKNLTKLESFGTPAVLKAGTWGAFALGGVAYEGIKQYMNFDKLMTQSVTQAGINKKELPWLNQTALDIAKKTGVSLTDMADIIYRAASGTASWNDGLGATKTQLKDVVDMVAKLSVVGNIAGGQATEQSSRVLTSLINAGMKDIGQMSNKNAANYNKNAVEKAAELYNAAIGAGDIKPSELISAMSRGLMQSAKANGMSARDTLAWVDLMTSMGSTGSVAGTKVTTGINQLANPTQQGAKALAIIGIKPGELQKIMSGNATYQGQSGLYGAVLDLRNKIQVMNPFANYPKYKGAGGKQGAINQLESWGVNQITPEFLSRWMAGKLSATDQMFATSQILTKSFGGSKQFATIATLLENPDKLKGILDYFSTHATKKSLDASIQEGMNTPAVQFNKMIRGFQVDLVEIGKAITPAFLKMGKALLGVVDWLTKTKVVLIPLVTVIGGLIVAAGLSKLAGVLRGGYGLIGGIIKGKNSLFGKLAGEDTTTGRYRTFGRFSKTRNEFTRMADLNAAKIAEKQGQDILKFGGFIDEFGAIVRGESRGGGSGGGSLKSKLEKDAEKKLVKEAEQKGLSTVEKDLLNKAGNNVVSKSAIRTALADSKLEGFGKGYGKGAKGIIDETFSKLNFGRGGLVGDAEKVVSKEAPEVLEKVGGRFLGGGLMSGAGDLLGGGLMSGAGDLLGGVLGGPIGMIAMTALAPMITPMIGKALGGLVNMFGGGKPTVTSPNANTTRVKLTAAQQALQDAQNQLASDMLSGKDTTKDLQNIAKLQGKITGLSGGLAWESGKNGFKHVYGAFKSMVSLKAMEQSLLTKDKSGIYSMKSGGWDKIFNSPQFKSLPPDLQKALKIGDITRFNKALSANKNSYANVLGANFRSDILNADSNWFNRGAAAKSAKGVSGFINKFIKKDYMSYGSPEQARSNYSTEMYASLRATAMAGIESSRAKNSTGAVRAAYEKQAKELTQTAANLKKGAEALAKKARLDPADIKAQADAAAQANKAVYKEVGLTADAFSAAMVSAINTAAGGLATIVNNQNSGKHARK